MVDSTVGSMAYRMADSKAPSMVEMMDLATAVMTDLYSAESTDLYSVAMSAVM